MDVIWPKFIQKIDLWWFQNPSVFRFRDICDFWEILDQKDEIKLFDRTIFPKNGHVSMPPWSISCLAWIKGTLCWMWSLDHVSGAAHGTKCTKNAKKRLFSGGLTLQFNIVGYYYPFETPIGKNYNQGLDYMCPKGNCNILKNKQFMGSWIS